MSTATTRNEPATKKLRLSLLGCVLGLALIVVWQSEPQWLANVSRWTREYERADEIVPPLGLLSVVVPDDNPMTSDKVELGRRLFFDRRLSRDQTVACASCHDPDKGYSIADQFATGVQGRKSRRHPPTLINVVYNSFQFWDGRVGSLGRNDSLEQQVLVPIRDPQEMDMTLEALTERLRAVPEYRERFWKIFGTDVTPGNIAKAIAAFERTLLSGNAPVDRYRAGDPQALSPAAARGFDLFSWKATCTACHSGPNFTDNGFHPSIAGPRDEKGDRGREAVTGDVAERGLFKTPTLREVGRRAPYMHDGTVATLAEVVERYSRGGFETHYWPTEERAKIHDLMTTEKGLHFRKNAAPQLRAGFPIDLSDDEKSDLVTFLKEGLSSDSYPLTSSP